MIERVKDHRQQRAWFSTQSHDRRACAPSWPGRRTSCQARSGPMWAGGANA